MRNSESTIRERYLPYPPSHCTKTLVVLSFSLSLTLLNRSREITRVCPARYFTRCPENTGTLVNCWSNSFTTLLTNYYIIRKKNTDQSWSKNKSNIYSWYHSIRNFLSSISIFLRKVFTKEIVLLEIVWGN